MGDKYEISGQAGAVGPGSTAQGNTFQQMQGSDAVVSEQLLEELARLREALAAQATTPDELREVASVEAAEAAAKREGLAGATRKLAGGVGKWALETATKIGTPVAAKAIQSVLGL